jgi:hypothetical protein
MSAILPHNYAFIKTNAVLTFIRWNVENVRGHEKAGRCSFFNMDDFLLMPSSSENIASLLGQAKDLLG